MQKITPTLWFDKNAEEAAKFYTSIFKNGKIGSTTHYTEAGFEVHHMPAGTVLTVEFQIEGYDFLALNGGPVFKFTPAISFMVNCPSAGEVDELWAKLSEGGTPLMPLDSYPFSPRYGWIQDKYGVSWQLIFMQAGAPRTIVPSLMFTGPQVGKAEEAINFYASIFPDSSVGMITRYGAESAPDKEGMVMYGEMTLAGQKFAAMDSAYDHKFNFNEAISFLVTCKDQAEIDFFWEKLSAVPASEQCGWLKDKYGVSWQIVPVGMDEMLNSPDKAKADRAMQAIMQMKKIDMAGLQAAFDGE